ncbi:hypothetical protein [Paracoccus thiocyanatus]|uniref:hypothetical protein n=1 Tax=Paracoccus thiocyanatus TaxID=34006 RepID=UPI0015F29F0D|nr:hypothetical protein [Paracoccus thiocyanatus]
MASQAIGSLYVALGLDSAAFTQGVKRVQGATGKLVSGLDRVGKAATDMGRKMSIVSGAMATAGAAAIALVKNTADAAKEISIQSKLANASTKEFQRWSAGSKTVGIQQDKLADILKDVNDRVGDFMETGGGPMADFFENVAPKVGVTAEQFKNLSGPQALQLYVDTLQKAGLNQQQMTFYMEAMASDATALIPLLMNGGAAMEGFGNAAERSGAVMSDAAIRGSLEFQEKLDALRQAVDGVRIRLSEALLPIVNRFMDVLIDRVVPAMDKAVQKIEGLIQWFGQLPGPVQDAAAGIAAALGLGGPVLFAIGTVSRAFSLLIVATGPVGLFIAAAAAAVAAWQVWGDDIKAAVGAAIDWISAKFQAFIDFLQKIIDKVTAVKDAIADALSVGNRADPSAGAASAEDMRGVGVDIGRGLISGVGQGIDGQRQELRSYLNSVTGTAKDEFDTHSPSRVFQQIGNWLMQGLGHGIGQGVPGVQNAMASVTDAVSGRGESLSESMNSFASSAQSAFQSVISGSMKVKDALRQVASQWLASFGNDMLTSAFGGLFGGIGANANGTSNWRGGLTEINERGGEIVDLPSGTRIIPHDVSKRMADRSGASDGTLDVRVGVDQNGNLQAFVERISGKVSAHVVSQNNRSQVQRQYLSGGK